MIIPYLLLLITIPSWGQFLSRFDHLCPGLYCRLKSENIYPDYGNRPSDVIHLELSGCQDHDLRMLQLAPRLIWLTVLHCDGNLDTKHLESHPNLEYLQLRLGNITELPLLSKMSKLNKLDLARNRIVRVLNGTFQNLTSLTELDLQDNLIRELPETVFHPLVMLDYLDLSRNQISQLSKKFLPWNSKVETLNLRENPLITLEFPFGLAPQNIKKIDLANCREMRGELDFTFEIETLTVEGSSVRSLSVPYLVELNAANSKLDNMGFMPDIRDLNLQNTSLTWFSASEILCKYKTLETVDLSNNLIKFISSTDTNSIWANPRKLNLSRNKLFDLPVNHSVFGSHLTWLDLSYNRLGSIDMGVFEGAYDLEVLLLQGNQLFNFDYRSDKLYSLRELALYDNDFDDSYCKQLAGYAKNNPLILHHSLRGHVCRDPEESKD